jgi:predicted dehydrogenase
MNSSPHIARRATRLTSTTTRREFLKLSTAGGLAALVPASLPRGGRPARAAAANDAIQIGVVGLGGIDTVGGVGGRGRQLIDALQHVPGTRIVALCDVDRAILEHEVGKLKDQRQEVAAYADIRKLLDDPTIDAVLVATPNHWHALATIWACQANKDVYVEKPFSHNIWEGRQMVAAARKHDRMVQVGTQSRSSPALRQAFDYLGSGQIGAVRLARAIVYRARERMIPLDGPPAVPDTVDYDLWCGPAPMAPLSRKQLHYDWHWFWSTGNGEIGNNGIHAIDICRWALRQDKPPMRALSIGGRFGFDDGGETPNTQIAFLDYDPAPLICEIRNLRASTNPDSTGSYRGRDHGVVIECEAGYFAGDARGGTVFDDKDRKIKDIGDEGASEWPDATHLANFVAAVRSRRRGDLHAEALEGHLSASCFHMANISQRIGQAAAPEAIAEAIRSAPALSDAFERCREHLRANRVDLGTSPAVMGPWVTYDGQRNRFVGEPADEANRLDRRADREPFVVPEMVA